MIDNDLKAEIKLAKETNSLMKKVNKYTTQSYGIQKIDVDGSTIYIGDNTYVRTYRFGNTMLSIKDKENIISLLCDKWKGHVRLSIINSYNEEQKRTQMMILTVYYVAADYYNAMFDINEFESLLTNSSNIIHLGIVKNDIAATIKILQYINGDLNEIGFTGTDFVKRSWNNLISSNNIEAKHIILESLSENGSVKEISQKYLKSFILSSEIKIFSESELDLYQRYINKRYGMISANDDASLEFNNLCGISVSFSTEAEDERIDKLTKELTANGYTTFCDNDDKKAYLNDYLIGIKAAHTLRLYDPAILISVI